MEAPISTMTRSDSSPPLPDSVAWTRRDAQYAYVDLLLREADIARASEVEHAVQRIDGDGHFGCAAPVRA